MIIKLYFENSAFGVLAKIGPVGRVAENVNVDLSEWK